MGYWRFLIVNKLAIFVSNTLQPIVPIATIVDKSEIKYICHKLFHIKC